MQLNTQAVCCPVQESESEEIPKKRRKIAKEADDKLLGVRPSPVETGSLNTQQLNAAPSLHRSLCGCQPSGGIFTHHTRHGTHVCTRRWGCGPECVSSRSMNHHTRHGTHVCTRRRGSGPECVSSRLMTTMLPKAKRAPSMRVHIHYQCD